MKKILIISLFLQIPLPSFASGFRCQAQCIGIDAQSETLIFAGLVQQAADLDRDSVFVATEGLCRQKLHQKWGRYLQAALVEHISFTSSETHETESYNQTSTSRARGADALLSVSRYRVIAAASVRDTQVSNWMSSYRTVDHRSLSANIDFATAEQKCTRDTQIPTGQLPYYTGDGPYVGAPAYLP